MIILDFEKPIFELDAKIKELKNLNTGDLSIIEDVKRLENKRNKMLRSIYSNLSAWEKVAVARHQERPHTSEYIKNLIEDFVPLAGDRNFGEDFAIIAGIGKFRGISVAVVGHEKGSDTDDRIKRNFGMPNPEGYRKVCRLMDLADKFSLPLISFVDTAGAHPGMSAEERGQAEAIAKCIERSLNFKNPIVTTIIGEGGSGGAVALAIANTIFMLEHSIYSVISPEGCASILYRDISKIKEATEALRLTAQDLLSFKLIDGIIDEPLGGAHRDPSSVIKAVGERIKTALMNFSGIQDFKKHRNEKFLNFCRSFQA